MNNNGYWSYETQVFHTQNTSITFMECKQYIHKTQASIIYQSIKVRIMNQLSLKSTRICRKCLQVLPLSAFYINKNSQYPDYYCKKCRGESNRMARKKHDHPQIMNKPKCYLVLTLVEDREQRIKLIRHAKQVVSESIARKQKRLREAMSDWIINNLLLTINH